MISFSGSVTLSHLSASVSVPNERQVQREQQQQRVEAERQQQRVQQERVAEEARQQQVRAEENRATADERLGKVIDVFA